MDLTYHKYDKSDKKYECQYITPMLTKAPIHYQQVLDKLTSRLFVTSFNADGTLKNNSAGNVLILRAVPGSKMIRDELIVHFTKSYHNEVRIVFNYSFVDKVKHEKVIELARVMAGSFAERVANAKLFIMTSRLRNRLKHLSLILADTLAKDKEEAMPKLLDVATDVCYELRQLRKLANLKFESGRLNVHFKMLFKIFYNTVAGVHDKDDVLQSRLNHICKTFFPTREVTVDEAINVLRLMHEARKGKPEELLALLDKVVTVVTNYYEQCIEASGNKVSVDDTKLRFKLVIQKRDDEKANVFNMLNKKE